MLIDSDVVRVKLCEVCKIVVKIWKCEDGVNGEFFVRVYDRHFKYKVNNVINKIALFETQIIGRTDGTAAVTMEIDLKTLIRQLQTVIQLTLLKYNSAFLAASFGRTSPYVLPQNELDKITHTLLRTKGFMIMVSCWSQAILSLFTTLFKCFGATTSND